MNLSISSLKVSGSGTGIRTPDRFRGVCFADLNAEDGKAQGIQTLVCDPDVLIPSTEPTYKRTAYGRWTAVAS